MTDVNYTKNIYDKFGQAYHTKRLSKNNSFYNEFIEIPAMKKLLKDIVKNKKILDIGCGSGEFTSQIKKMGANVIGADLSKTLIDIAKKDYSNISFYICDAQKTPFKKNIFDIVSSSLMIHYIKNLDKLFKEISRIIKNNGQFIFSFHHPTNEVVKKIIVNDKKEYIIKEYFHNDKYFWNMLEGMEMLSYHHTFENISLALNKSGFVIEKIIEPTPIKGSRKYDPSSYDRTINHPSFCIIQARKINH